MSHAKEEQELIFGASDRIELIATIVMALAAILTAWSAFESAKWSGEQATSFSMAGAARTESTRFDTQAGQQQAVDVAVFTSWLDAANNDINDGLVDLEAISVPVDGTLSGFLYARVRDEFRPAFVAWLDAFEADRFNSPKTPFEMDEYVLAAAIEADRLTAVAEGHAADAGEANQTSDDYVLNVVLFALVIFFAGVSSKLVARRNRWIAISLSVVLFGVAAVAVFSLPIISPF